MPPLRACVLAWLFLTRLPGPAVAGTGVDWRRAVACFPLVGGILGVLVAGVDGVLHDRLAPATQASWLWGFLWVAALAVVSGGLHLDGLADWADAMGAGGRAARMRAIMRDPRIGSFGAAALVLILLGKVLAAGAILRMPHHAPALVAWPMVGRSVIVPLILAWPYARRKGAGRVFVPQGRAEWNMPAVFTAAGALTFSALRFPAATGAALVAALGVAQWTSRRIGGLTGDVYGAALEIAEWVFLFAVAIQCS